MEILSLVTNIEENIKYIIMTEENISQEFRLKNKAETRIHFIEEINQNELMRNKHNKHCGVLITLNIYLF